MMDITYRRDPEANYLVIEDERLVEEQFSLRMLENNASDCFLRLSLKQMNGFTSLWYRVTSMQPLERMFERRPMGSEDIMNLMGKYYRALEEVRTFLLDPEAVVLDPSYIFMTPDRREIRFIYVPFFAEPEDHSLKKLSEYILRKLDHKDSAAVEIGYELYERIADTRESFAHVWEKIRNAAEKRNEEKSRQEGMEEDPEKLLSWEMQADDFGSGNRLKSPGMAEKGERRSRPGRSGAKESAVGRSSRRERSAGRSSMKEGNSWKKPAVWIAGTILAVGILILAVWYLELDVMQTGGLFFGSIALAWLICTLVRGRKGEGAHTESDAEDLDDEEFWNALMTRDSSDLQAQNYLPGDALPILEGTGRAEAHINDESRTSAHRSVLEAVMEEEKWIHGTTRALGEVDRRSRVVLVSQDIRRCRDITLESAVNLIGKSTEVADAVIALDVVSRVHARIDQTPEGIFLTDLNSMNGTFVNEKRLIPNERVRIREGDHISFATVHFKVARRDY